jgi:hypothetical protein
MACRACGFEHRPTVRCEAAARIREQQERAALAEVLATNPLVANALVANNGTMVANAMVANAPTPTRAGDRHRKTEARRAYMRELMRRRRAAVTSQRRDAP